MPQELTKTDRVRRVLDNNRWILNTESYYLSLFIALTALELNKNPNDVIDSELLAGQLKMVLLRLISYNQNAQKLFLFSKDWMEQFTFEEIMNLIIDTSPLSFTNRLESAEASYSVLPIVDELVKTKKPNRCLDICSGIGNTMIRMAMNGASEVHGVEINHSSADMSYLRLYALQKTVDSFNFMVTSADAFQFSEHNREQKYDFIFSEFPWGISTEADSPMAKWQDKKHIFPKVSRNSEWKFIALANEHLSYNGIACLLAPESITFKQADEEIRSYFIEHGYIEQIISLPEKLLDYTGISALLLILSKGNKTVRFFDAKSIYITEGRRRYLPEKEIQRFFSKTDPNLVVKTTHDVTQENKLNPSFHVVSSYTEGLQLQNLAQIIRARMIKKADLDMLLSEEVTNIEFIRPKHLNDGIVSASEFLKAKPANGTVLQNDDVLISRVGSKIDCAVYVAHPEIVSIADENLYVVRCDITKLNPNYLLAYLQSELGRKHLAANYEGSTISRISLESLKKLSIPTSSIEEQNVIGSEMKDYLRYIQKLQIELETLQEKIDDQLNEWFKG